jgi:hypothetical protein
MATQCQGAAFFGSGWLSKRSGTLNKRPVPPIENPATTWTLRTDHAMKSSIFALSALLAIMLITSRAFSQNSAVETSALNSMAPLPADGLTHSAAFVTAPPRLLGGTRTYRPFSGLGFATRVGFGGAGFDVATPLARKFNLRVGTDFFNYDTSFQEEGADVGVNLHLRSGHVALDWFPFGGHLRLSPQLVFGNNNRVLATAVIPSGSTVTLNGQD